jgi:hypothetical protein
VEATDLFLERLRGLAQHGRCEILDERPSGGLALIETKKKFRS